MNGERDLFDRARRAVRIEDLAAKHTTLKSAGGDELRGSCPLCHKGDKGGSEFKVSRDRQSFYCFSCGAHGDVAELQAQIAGIDVVEAARELAGHAPLTAAAPRPEREVKRDEEKAARILRMAGDMWRQAKDLVGTIGAPYLRDARGIEPDLVVRCASLVRFHEAAPHHWDERARVWVKAPALIVKAVTEGGWPGGVHVTYLKADGSGKADLDPPRRMWGPHAEKTPAGARRCGAWLIDPDDDAADLVGGEGIETSLSLASALWRRGKRDIRVFAALSLNALQGGEQRDKDGCLDLRAPTYDPAKPPFLWTPCNTGAEKPPGVHLAIDRDMSPVNRKTRTGRGRIVPVVLDAEARAKLCARLACSAWRAAGWSPVKAYLPSPNRDWNDEIKGA